MKPQFIILLLPVGALLLGFILFVMPQETIPNPMKSMDRGKSTIHAPSDDSSEYHQAQSPRTPVTTAHPQPAQDFSSAPFSNQSAIPIPGESRTLSEVPEEIKESFSGKFNDQIAGSDTSAVMNATRVTPGTSFVTVPTGDSTGQAAALANTRTAHSGKAASSSLPMNSRGETEIQVPFGAKIPIVELDDWESRTPQQRAAMQKIQEDFYADIEEGATENGADPIVWERARTRADERYRILFGDAAFNAMTMQAALEALQEKKAASSPNR